MANEGLEKTTNEKIEISLFETHDGLV